MGDKGDKNAARPPEGSLVETRCLIKGPKSAIVPFSGPRSGPKSRTGPGAICPAVEKFVFISFFSSDRIKLGFLCFFYREGHGLAEKSLLLIFFFLTNFIDISLCADPMRRNPFFLHFEESLSTDNIRRMVSRSLDAIIILCVW